MTAHKTALKKRTEVRFFSYAYLYGHYIYGTKLTAVLGIGLSFKRHLLPFLQSAETFRLNCREVYKNIVATFVIGQKTITLAVVEPFNSSVHNVTSY